MRRHIRCCTLHVKSGVGIPGQETTLGVPCWHGWEAGGSLLHTHRNPPPFRMVMGTCLPQLLPSWCEEAEDAQDELRMHRHFTLLCKPSRADLQHQPTGLHGAERIRTNQASLELRFPCGVCLFEPPSSKLCCIKRGAPGDTREPAAIWPPAAAELSLQATAQTAHPESDVITNLVRRELFLLAV